MIWVPRMITGACLLYCWAMLIRAFYFWRKLKQSGGLFSEEIKPRLHILGSLAEVKKLLRDYTQVAYHLLFFTLFVCGLFVLVFLFSLSNIWWLLIWWLLIAPLSLFDACWFAHRAQKLNEELSFALLAESPLK